MLISLGRVVKSRCVYENDAGSVSFVVQNTRSLEILGDGLEATSRPPLFLASESIDNLLMDIPS